MQMKNNTIKSHYDRMLALNYNKKDELVRRLNNSINLYKNSKHRDHPKAIDRIELYNKIINHANA